METNSIPRIYRGQTFRTFQEFLDLLQKRNEILNEKLVIGGGSRTIKRANELVKKTSPYREDFVYAWVNYRCKHEGTFSTRGTKSRTRT